MINWLWAIPWVVIIIFFAGWHFGGKVSVRKEIRDQMHEREDRESERRYSEAVREIYKHLDDLESKIERIYATKIKEEHNNG